MYVLERLERRQSRGAKIYGELAGYAMNSDASDFVLPNPERQAECMRLALRRAGIAPEQVDIVSTHATGTGQRRRARSARRCDRSSATRKRTPFNNTKSFIGHAMGAAGALELAGNLPAFDDGVCHATINVDELDPECELAGPGRQPTRTRMAGPTLHPEQFVRHAGHQFGRDHQASYETTYMNR